MLRKWKSKWRKNFNYDKGVLLFLPEYNLFVRISIGTGDNLTREEEIAGYDYLYVDSFKFDGCEFEELDGGMKLFKPSEINYDKNLKQFCLDGLNIIGFCKGCKYTILQTI